MNKQKGGSKNQQSMAEAVAKHLKDFLSGAQPAIQAAIEAAALAPAPAVAVVATTPALRPPSAYQQEESVHVDPAIQMRPQPVLVQEESLGDAARRSKQQKACLELAKDNPSVNCK